MTPLDAALPFVSVAQQRFYSRARVVQLLLVSVLCGVHVLVQPLWIPILTAIVPHALVLWRRR